MTITILTISSAVIYAIYLMVCRKAWQEERGSSTNHSTDTRLSLVVTLHNEEDTVYQLLESIYNQSTKPDEVIMVCDHCTDSTISQIRSYIESKEANNIQIVENAGQQGKKTAQKAGIEIARNEYIAVTDGDCILKPEWMTSIVNAISGQEPDLLIAPVVMKANGNRLSQRLMELEFLSLQMISAGTAIRKTATMCNGANMAFRRSIYLQHDQHSQYVSGDDMFLLSEVKRRKGKVVYIKSPDSIVETHCPQDIYSYYKQRTRWLRKATGYTDKDIKWLSVVVFIGNASWPIALIAAPYIGFTAAITCFVIKTISEYLLINSGKRFWGTQSNVADIIALAVIYPFVLFSIAIATTMRSKTKW
ncbi:MAG: glycosyltransferase [Bacteroidales bacterium]|nr:glycosyltransferase [Bacteroidales bacterium]